MARVCAASCAIKLAVGWLVILSCATLAVSSAVADEATAPLLTAETVRSDYKALAKSWVPIPDMALNAVVAAEDPAFFFGPAQNSTITVQLGKRYIKAGMRTILLKVTQYHNATTLARELTHEEILNWYAQEIYLGGVCYGLVDSAAEYFGRDVDALEVQDYALLAGLIRSPGRYDPVRTPDRATERRNQVIDEMLSARFLTQAQAADATATELGVRLPVGRCDQE